jgi:hypothetical protein
MGIRVDRVVYEDNEGQDYRIRSRVDVVETAGRAGGLEANPLDGRYSVVQCERFEEGGRPGLRISLQLIRETAPIERAQPAPPGHLYDG